MYFWTLVIGKHGLSPARQQAKFPALSAHRFLMNFKATLDLPRENLEQPHLCLKPRRSVDAAKFILIVGDLPLRCYCHLCGLFEFRIRRRWHQVRLANVYFKSTRCWSERTPKNCATYYKRRRAPPWAELMTTVQRNHTHHILLHTAIDFLLYCSLWLLGYFYDLN